MEKMNHGKRKVENDKDLGDLLGSLVGDVVAMKKDYEIEASFTQSFNDREDEQAEQVVVTLEFNKKTKEMVK